MPRGRSRGERRRTILSAVRLWAIIIVVAALISAGALVIRKIIHIDV